MELIYIGERFYRDSQTMMSSIYDIDGKRQDWGKIQIDLENGESVHIRQATEGEMIFYEGELAFLVAQRKKREGQDAQNS
jgi:hypothetical protein